MRSALLTLALTLLSQSFAYGGFPADKTPMLIRPWPFVTKQPELVELEDFSGVGAVGIFRDEKANPIKRARHVSDEFSAQLKVAIQSVKQDLREDDLEIGFVVPSPLSGPLYVIGGKGYATAIISRTVLFNGENFAANPAIHPSAIGCDAGTVTLSTGERYDIDCIMRFEALPADVRDGIITHIALTQILPEYGDNIEMINGLLHSVSDPLYDLQLSEQLRESEKLKEVKGK